MMKNAAQEKYILLMWMTIDINELPTDKIGLFVIPMSELSDEELSVLNLIDRRMINSDIDGCSDEEIKAIDGALNKVNEALAPEEYGRTNWKGKWIKYRVDNWDINVYVNRVIVSGFLC